MSVSVVRDRKHTTKDWSPTTFRSTIPPWSKPATCYWCSFRRRYSNQTFTLSGWTSLERVDGISSLTVEAFYRRAARPLG